MFVLSLFGCESIGYVATKAIPPLELINPSWAVDPVDCDESRNAPLPARGCVLQKVQCGDVIEGTTTGGISNFDDDFYQEAFCTPRREDYEDSPEAVYMLTVPGDIRADIRLDTNCAELDIFAIRWDRKDCPTRKHTRSIPQCEFNDKPGGGYLTITTVERPETYLIGADGKNGAHGNFRMAIECSTYR
jgi:hypothetical protein